MIVYVVRMAFVVCTCFSVHTGLIVLIYIYIYIYIYRQVW